MLRIDDAFERGEELLRGVGDNEIDLEMIAKGGLDEVAFVFPEQAVIDEDAHQLLADGAVE